MKLINGRWSVRDDIEREFKTGKASRVIRPFAIGPKDKILIVGRKSGCEREKNLDDSIANLTQVVESACGTVVDNFRWKGSGWDPDWIAAAVLRARRMGATVLLAETTDRFIRNLHYHSVNNPDLQATDEQLDEVARLADGMTLMTHLNPDATPSEVRGYQSARGQRIKNRTGGRPKNPGSTRHRRWVNLVDVRRARRRGMSLREIAVDFGISKSVIYDWLNR